MSAREQILSRIRSRVGKDDAALRAARVEERLAAHQQNIIPARGQGDEAHRVKVFTDMMLAVGGSVEVLDHFEDVPEAVANYLRGLNLPARIRRGADETLATLPWHRAGAVRVDEGRADPADTASLSLAFAGVAESGTIMMLSGPDNPTTLNFLPEAHVVVLPVERLHAAYEEAWTRLRQQVGQGNMPRTVNMISGPSRTADIEQTIVRPAHGPKEMHVIIVRG
jgi:L-lactate dehydrogenase complex protein LldG